MVLSVQEREIQRVFNNSKISERERKILRGVEANERADSKSIDTRKNKMQSIEKFCLFFRKPFNKAKKQDLINYLADLNNNLAPSSVLLHKIIIKWFYKWYYLNHMNWKPRYEKDYPDIVGWIKCTNVNSHSKLPQELLTQDDIKKLVDTTSSFRNKAIVMLLFDGALRIGEALSLEIRHLVFDNYGGYIIIPKSKTGMRKVRLVDSIPYLKNYIDKEHPSKNNPNSSLFVGVEVKGTKKKDLGQPLDSGGVRIFLTRLAKKAEIKKKVYPNLFRHSKLTEMTKD